MWLIIVPAILFGQIAYKFEPTSMKLISDFEWYMEWRSVNFLQWFCPQLELCIQYCGICAILIRIYFAIFSQVPNVWVHPKKLWVHPFRIISPERSLHSQMSHECCFTCKMCYNQISMARVLCNIEHSENCHWRIEGKMGWIDWYWSLWRNWFDPFWMSGYSSLKADSRFHPHLKSLHLHNFWSSNMSLIWTLTVMCWKSSSL